MISPQMNRKLRPGYRVILSHKKKVRSVDHSEFGFLKFTSRSADSEAHLIDFTAREVGVRISWECNSKAYLRMRVRGILCKNGSQSVSNLISFACVSSWSLDC